MAFSPLNLHRLTYFRAIAAHGSFSAAARAMNVAQPALTHHMRAMEAELGLTVFDRSSRGVELTPAGRVLLSHAGTILDAVATAAAELRQIAGKTKRRPLRLAMIPSVATTLTAPLIAAIERELPDISLRIVEIHARNGPELVAKGEVDAAVTLFDRKRPSALPLFWESLFLVSRPDVRAAESVPFADLASERLLLPAATSGVRSLLADVAKDAGVRLNIVGEIDGVGARKQAVLAGLGSTVLPWASIAEEHAAGVLLARPIVDPAPNRLIVLDIRDGLEAAISDTLRSLLERLIETKKYEIAQGRIEGIIAPPAAWIQPRRPVPHSVAPATRDGAVLRQA